jgi:hypothetical protein
LHDLEFGPEGALYLLDYGQGMYASNGNDGLYRITYKGCLPPVSVRRNALRLAGSSDIVLVNLAQGLPDPPEGATRAEIFNLQGRLLWSGRLNPSQGRAALPTLPGAGLARVRWSW